MTVHLIKEQFDELSHDILRVRTTEENGEARFVENENGIKTLYLKLPPKEKRTRRKGTVLVRKAIRMAKQHRAKKVALSLDDFLFLGKGKGKEVETAELAAQNAVLANFDFITFKTKPKPEEKEIEELFVLYKQPSVTIKRALERGAVVGEGVNACRALANTPGGDMTPRILGVEAKHAAGVVGLTVKILGQKELEKEKMGAVLGVARGSKEEPQFIILEHRGGGKRERPIVLAGKGVTYDTGGLSLKPADSMLDMHLDMSGGAAVIHTLVLAARLKLRKNVIGLIPAVENMPSGESYRPGDILTSMSGKTIEVLNTDAEGRVILADALTYAKRYNPRLVVDVATLTGASLIALGQHASAIMTESERLEKTLRALGEETGDYVWPLPLWDEYEQYVKGNFADVANLPTFGNTRYAGVINAGMFLREFTKEYSDGAEWAHIDMASGMLAAPGDQLGKGATGTPIRLLLKLIETY